MRTDMTPDEYREKIDEINVECDLKKTQVGIEYAKSNNNINIGDLVTDNIGTIRVDIIRYYTKYTYTNYLPECVYGGIVCTQKGLPLSDGKSRFVWASQITKVKKNET